MLETELSVVGSSPEDGFLQIFPQTPLLSSHKAAWSGISLEHHYLPPGETPEYTVEQYILSINIGQSFQYERIIAGHLQTGLIANGAVGVCPLHLPHMLRWSEAANLLLLKLEPQLLTRHALELLGSDRVELVPYFAVADPLIQQIGLALRAELQLHGSNGRLYAESMANALAVHLLRHCSTQRQNIPVYPGGLPLNKLQLVTDYINDYLERELSLNELAAIAQLSPYHFSRAFKQSTGFSPHQYVIQQRVERAKQLLRQGKMSIAEIAIACGFTHQSHLNRHFKRLTGVTPRTLLKSQQ